MKNDICLTVLSSRNTPDSSERFTEYTRLNIKQSKCLQNHTQTLRNKPGAGGCLELCYFNVSEDSENQNIQTDSLKEQMVFFLWDILSVNILHLRGKGCAHTLVETFARGGCQERSKSLWPAGTNSQEQCVPRVQVSGAIKGSRKNIDDLYNLRWTERERERDKKINPDIVQC